MKIFGIILIILGALGFLGTEMLFSAIDWYDGEYVYSGFYGYSLTVDILFIIIGVVVFLKANNKGKSE